MSNNKVPENAAAQEKRSSRVEKLFYGTATVGERGQIVIPAQARREFEIETGDKLLILGHPDKHGLMICKIDAMREFMSGLLEGLRIVESHAQEHSDNGVISE
jgi:AbrB family looped-hinge helix DNA binding protein